MYLSEAWQETDALHILLIKETYVREYSQKYSNLMGWCSALDLVIVGGCYLL